MLLQIGILTSRHKVIDYLQPISSAYAELYIRNDLVGENFDILAYLRTYHQSTWIGLVLITFLLSIFVMLSYWLIGYKYKTKVISYMHAV